MGPSSNPGSRGPVPKPSAVKAARGTSKKKINRREPKIGVAAPTMPDDMTEAARAEARRLTAEAMTLRVLTRTDRGVILAAAQAYDVWQQAEKSIRKRGVLIRERNVGGNLITKANPATKIVADAWRRYVSALCQLGLTPAMRQRVVALEDTDPRDDPAARYMQ